MAYQVIARKWRPQTFEEVTGQEAITRTLRNAIEHERLHHAYLFSGARGVGKTTTARLLAKALNCHKTDKPTVNPCSIDDKTMCASCREITESRSIDVLEIDAASHTGIDDVRETIIESINVNPARDRYKIFIIDEVHQLSKPAFNALLKTLEEPPPNVVFIMATTELHKVPDTILSRCQEFEFRTIATTKIFERLKFIAEAEKVDVADEALREIARAGEGSMRDAQSAFDQVISFSGERIETQDVINALGIASSEMLSQTVGAIATQNAKEILDVVEELTRRGQDLRNFCRDLLSHFRDLLVAKIASDAEELFDSAILTREELFKQTQNFTEADLIRFFNSLSETESRLKDASSPRYALEIGLIKLIEMRRVAPIERVLERLADLENAISNGDFQNKQITKNSPASKQIDLDDFVAPTPEKKTSIIDFPPMDAPFPVASDASTENFAKNSFEADEEFSTFESKSEILPAPSVSSEKFIINSDSLFVKLPPITSEDLEHIEDNWLDTAYENRLIQEGEDLSVIANASLIVKNVLRADISVKDLTPKFEPQVSNGAAAFAPAKTQSVAAQTPPVFEPEKISDEIPALPENPTEEELWRYAENHPKVKLVMQVFRAKIVGVSQEKS